MEQPELFPITRWLAMDNVYYPRYLDRRLAWETPLWVAHGTEGPAEFLLCNPAGRCALQGGSTPRRPEGRSPLPLPDHAASSRPPRRNQARTGRLRQGDACNIVRPLADALLCYRTLHIGVVTSVRYCGGAGGADDPTHKIRE